MTTEIEALESRIRHCRDELQKAEAELQRIMNDSRRPEENNIYGIKTREDWNRQAWRGCWLANYRPGYIAVFEPNGGGSYGGIYGALADELGKEEDAWNFGIYQRRAETPREDK